MELITFNYHMPVSIHFSTNPNPVINDFIDNPDDFLLIVSNSFCNNFPEIADKFKNHINISSQNSHYPDITNLTATKLPNCKNVIGIGGGSVLDTAKALFARLITDDKILLTDMLKDAKLLDPFLSKRQEHQLILLPTTFGTSSEVTPWGTIWNWEIKKKFSLSHPFLFADKALIFPELSASLTKEVKASTGLDVFSHALESYWNKSSYYLTKQYSLTAIKLCLEYLPIVVSDPLSSDARTHMAKASLLAGKAFSQTKTAAAHAISYPLTLFHGISHGIACGITLGEIFDLIYPENKKDLWPILELMQKYYGEQGMSFQECFKNFLAKCNIPTNLREYGIKKEDLQKVVDNSFHSGRSENMNYPILKKDILNILERIH
jgi:alcohol dehydrogenase class IV